MKQFSQGEYLDELSRRVITREGGEVKIIRVFTDDVSYSILASVDKGTYMDISFYTKEGNHFHKNYESPYDLFFVPRKTEVGAYLKYLFTKFIFRIKYTAK